MSEPQKVRQIVGEEKKLRDGEKQAEQTLPSFLAADSELDDQRGEKCGHCQHGGQLAGMTT